MAHGGISPTGSEEIGTSRRTENPFQLGPGRMVPQNGGEKKKGCFAIIEVVTRENTINIHQCIHGVVFKNCTPQALREIWKFAIKEMGNPDVCSDTRLTKLSEPKE